jgi:hypothetical protein
MKTFAVKISLLGKVRRVEVWAASSADASRKALIAYPGAVVLESAPRKAF